MYYSVTFESIATGEKRNTWEDWHLIPSAPPMVAPPEAYKNFVDIPGRKEGNLDLSEVLTSKPSYTQSEGSWDFIWSPEYCISMSRVQAYNTVLQFIHGKRMRVTFEENPDVSYTGRFYVSGCQPGGSYSAISIEYVIDPWL